MTDTSKLREAVHQSGLKYNYIAAAIGITPFGLQKKIENRTEFKASEIIALANLLDLSPKDRDLIFFAPVGDL